MTPTPLIDLFAGPGGLAEGFSSLKVGAHHPFKIALSVEKDARAHETLLLRGFYRQFPDGPPLEYWQHLQGVISRESLFDRYPKQHTRASQECVRHELGPHHDTETRDLVRGALRGHDGMWGLIGGPPCQAYSLIGRSRNLGVAGYVPEKDHRQTLYLEYLQILADHRPSFFVMENVKGLLSATLDNEALFERIVDDLQHPTKALKREGRRSQGSGPRYDIFPLSRPASGLFGPLASDVLVRSEEHGIPQARHRVILLGVQQGVRADGLKLLVPAEAPAVGAILRGLPQIRSGVTDDIDSDDHWLNLIRGMVSRPWTKQIDAGVREVVKDSASRARRLSAGRGSEFLRTRNSVIPELGGVINHAARAHISADLERYFFAACYAQLYGRSPTLGDFPSVLLPNHSSAAAALHGGHFADRFRVQVENKPATTITSHISKDGHYYIHPDPLQCRSLSVREAARLQTFPDDYLFCGPRTSQYHQVGNAVPPALARQIAEVVSKLV